MKSLALLLVLSSALIGCANPNKTLVNSSDIKIVSYKNPSSSLMQYTGWEVAATNKLSSGICIVMVWELNSITFSGPSTAYLKPLETKKVGILKENFLRNKTNTFGNARINYVDVLEGFCR